jgi:hypothetical protein
LVEFAERAETEVEGMVEDECGVEYVGLVDDVVTDSVVVGDGY